MQGRCGHNAVSCGYGSGMLYLVRPVIHQLVQLVLGDGADGDVCPGSCRDRTSQGPTILPFQRVEPCNVQSQVRVDR